MRYYVGNPLQTRGAERYTLHGGKGEGMQFLYVRNGLGLEAWISLDRAGDVSRVQYLGENMGYFAPCGYVAPSYYDAKGAGFLKSFTAGFFTTCGLTAVGSPCVDEGEELPLHGTVSHIPAEFNGMEEREEELVLHLTIRDAVLFGRKLTMKRTYTFSYKENSFAVEDLVTNEGDAVSPYMILYHCNMGYPLLSEHAVVKIPNNDVKARDLHAKEFMGTALEMEPPQKGYRERCYYYDVVTKNDIANVGIYNHDIQKGVIFSYDKKTLPCFTQWKMMGETDYVLGLEPGNCTPDGRDVLRKNGTLQFLQPSEKRSTSVTFMFVSNKKEFDEVF